MTLLDTILPQYEFNERHTVVINATPEDVLRSIKELRAPEITLLRPLFSLRLLPERLFHTKQPAFDDTQPMLSEMCKIGFTHLAEDAERELVIGTIQQFWKLVNNTPHKVQNLQEFEQFTDPAYGKAVMNFSLSPAPKAQGTLVSTETRIHIPDPACRRKFALYWRVVYPGSAVIRQMWLKAIKKRAERA